MLFPSQEIEIVIPGVPVAKARPRFSVRKSKKTGRSFVLTYKQSEEQTVEGKWILLLREQLRRSGWQIATTDPLIIFLMFEMPYPSGMTKAQTALIEEGYYPKKIKNGQEVLVVPRQDVDNLAKFALDCMNNEVYSDDALIVNMTADKTFSKEPKTTITIRRMFNEKCAGSDRNQD
jgi:Holliday junction resolvase RusA-like endonuclease